MTNQPIEEKVKEWLSQGVAREWPEVVAFIENLLEQERQRMSEEIESEYPTHKDIKISGHCNTQCHKITENLVKEKVLSIINK